MKYLFLAGLLSVFLFTPNSAQAQGGFSVTISVDENCNGSLTNSSGFSSALPCSLQADPGPGGLASAVTYGLLSPPGLVTGDLIMDEPGGGVSDVIRFNPDAGSGGTMVFYSDNSDGVDSLADTGLPGSFYANDLIVTEIGAEGSNGFDYTPTAGQPGFVAGSAGPVTYNTASDSSAPEPASTLLMLGGAGLLFGRKYLFKRAC